MTHQNLLACATIDLSGAAWFTHDWTRIAASLVPGKAGDLFEARVDGAAFALRRAAPPRAIGAARFAGFAPHRGEQGEYTLLVGRIAERAALADRLGCAPPTEDAALYALAFARWGEDCDRRIVGDYAAIQWFPEKRRARLARSPIMAPPLHVWRDGDRLVVASLVRSIFAAGATTQVDDARLADLLLTNPHDQTRGWYRGIGRVACGTVERHDARGTSARRYWSVEDIAPVRFARDDDYVEAVDEGFRRAVRSTLEPFERPALMLSGGLDSQAIAGYMADVLPQGTRIPSITWTPLPGFSGTARPWGFDDEGGHVRDLAAMLPQLDPHFVDGVDLWFGEGTQDLYALGSWPVHNEIMSPFLHRSYALAAQMGCDATIAGDLGNAGFSHDGLTGFPGWLTGGNWRRLWREVRLADDPRPLGRRLVSLAAMPLLPARWRDAFDRRRGFDRDPFASWCALRPDYARSSGALQRARDAGIDLSGHGFASANAWRRDVVDFANAEGPEIQLAYRLLYGVGRHDPTAFRPFLELCFGIPDEQYLRDGEPRWLARRLLRGRVPESVRTERRQGFVVGDWPARIAREKPRLLGELAALKEDDRLAAIIDLDRLERDLAAWQGRDVPEQGHARTLNAAVMNGIAAARFVRYAEGRNVGRT